MEPQKLIFTAQPGEALAREIERIAPDNLFVLCDTHTRELSLPLMAELLPHSTRYIDIEAGDTHKTLEALAHVWDELSRHGASRKSLLVNLGGGMVTDLGGFAAACFKRGIRFINMPTTLLGAVDAAVGGKTGINFNGLKNEIGAFRPADTVIISTRFFHTLPHEELLSGYAEMLKHALIDSPESYRALLDFDLAAPDWDRLLRLLEESVQVKQRIVAQDPLETGIRKALNLGHTVGHAFESLSHHRGTPIPHGYAVAWGLVCELLLSHHYLQFPSDLITGLAQYIYRHYGAFAITCKDYETLYELMTHDKKNEAGHINFTLLQAIGHPIIDQHADKEEVFIAFDLYRDLFKL